MPKLKRKKILNRYLNVFFINLLITGKILIDELHYLSKNYSDYLQGIL